MLAKKGIMDRKHINKIIGKKIKHLKKQAKAIPVSDGQEAVHQLRTDYKKLRALVRLLNAEPGAKKIKLPGRLKKIYHQAGVLREWQLYRDEIAPSFAKDAPYMESINQKIKKERKKLEQALDKIDFAKVRRKIKTKLPGHTHETLLDTFIQEKMDAGCEIVKPEMADAELHQLRKYFKDVRYNLKLQEDDVTHHLPLKNKKEIRLFDKLPDELNNHQDYVVNLSLL